MKTILSACIMVFFLQGWNECQSQNRAVPKNFPGLFAGVEWNTLSGLTGVSYERSLIKKDSWTLGIKAQYVFTYENGNMQIIFDSFDGQSSLASVMSTAQFFTSKRKENYEGFFLQFGVGAGSRKYEHSDVKRTYTVPCTEFGLGWQFYLGKKTTLVWHNSILFAGEGGITVTKISFGF